MFAFFSEILQKNHIDCFAPISLSDCRLTRPYLLERAGIKNGTAVMMAIPYFTRACMDPDRNISAYAVSRDYHLFFKHLFADILPQLRERFPTYRFEGFADHSPIAECEAAARAGLGVIGQNHLLITERYSSYVFLGEIITNAEFPCKTRDILECEGCGACKAACPIERCGVCFSALTQKKGALTEHEANMLREQGLAWGCDLCQESCPHTRRAIATGTILSPIPFFSKQTASHVTQASINDMSDEEFGMRAYSWRGRDTLLRNLKIIEENQARKEEHSC
jgi:epoxyqueuosine reductase